MSSIYLTVEDLEKCRLAKSIIEKEYGYHITQNELVQRVFLNKNKLTRGFKEITGDTIHEFLTKLRMEKAQELLETTDLTVETIAGRLGLHHSNLIKQFKAFTGSTPKEWRNRNRHHNQKRAC